MWASQCCLKPPGGQERELREMVASGVYEAGFENLRRHLAAGRDLQARGSAPMPSALPVPARRVVLRAYGGPEQLVGENTECAAPRDGEVRLRQRAVGVNYLDIYLRRGEIAPMLAPGGTPGMEAAGSVLDVGPNVSGWLPGDRVAYLGPQPGAYASVRCVPAGWLVRLPAAVEDETAAALLLKGITAESAWATRPARCSRSRPAGCCRNRPPSRARWCSTLSPHRPN